MTKGLVIHVIGLCHVIRYRGLNVFCTVHEPTYYGIRHIYVFTYILLDILYYLTEHVHRQPYFHIV